MVRPTPVLTTLGPVKSIRKEMEKRDLGTDVTQESLSTTHTSQTRNLSLDTTDVYR